MSDKKEAPLAPSSEDEVRKKEWLGFLAERYSSLTPEELIKLGSAFSLRDMHAAFFAGRASKEHHPEKAQLVASEAVRELWIAEIYEETMGAYWTKEAALKHAWLNSEEHVFRVREVLIENEDVIHLGLDGKASCQNVDCRQCNEMDMALQRIQQLEVALQYYADVENYKDGSGRSEFTCEFGEVEERTTIDVLEDEGKIARDALKEARSAK